MQRTINIYLSIVTVLAETSFPLLKVFDQTFFKKFAGVDGVHGLFSGIVLS